MGVVFVRQALQSSRASLPLFPLPVAGLGPDSKRELGWWPYTDLLLNPEDLWV